MLQFLALQPKPKESSNQTPAQRRMYDLEKLDNFRWISKLCATPSSYRLSSADLASADLHRELADWGQYAELTYSALPPEFIFHNLTTLIEKDFPLEGYDTLLESSLVKSFRGSVTDLPGYVAYRPTTKSLILAIAGTTNGKQALYDLRTMKHPHPEGRGCSVHSGFWALYMGIKSAAINAIEQALEAHDVGELVLTGHSMGGALCHLLTLDLMSDGGVLPPGLPIKVAVFGAPRCGNHEFSVHWRQVMDEYRTRHGKESVREYSVKGYNDGVPSLPPLFLGFRHISQTPFYFVGGRLYQIPSTESEYASFPVTPEDKDEGHTVDHPRGGHNYYNGRDMEKFLRRMGWLEKLKSEYDDWYPRYKEHIAARECHEA